MITFIQINLLLALVYILFRGVRKLEALLKLESSHIASLRVAQGLVLLAIVSPFLFKMMPIKREVINPPMFEIKEEERSVAIKETKKKINTIIKETPVVYQNLEKRIDFDNVVILKILFPLGFLFFLGRLGKDYWKLKKLLSRSFVLKQTKKVRVALSEDISIPFSVRMLSGYWVAMPLDLLGRKKDFTLALKHEFQHHRQVDTTWAVLIELLVCAFYFNPAIYLWKNTIIELQEFSCDEALTGQSDVLSHDYGSCLIRVAETALKNRQMYAGTTSMAVVFKSSRYFKTFLLRRIEMIAVKRKNHSKWLPVCTGLVIALCTVTLAYGVEKVMKRKEGMVNAGKLIVDAEVQKIADESLTRALKQTKALAGFVIVSDPMTGKVLAVSNMDMKGMKKGYWSLSQLIEPASFAKSLVIAEALEKGVTTPAEKHNCENGKYNYKGRIYRDWKTKGWDELSTTEALTNSSDICSLKVAEKVGEKDLKKMGDKFGFGANGVAQDFPEAKVGDGIEMEDQFIPKVTLGYAFKMSPIELMQAYGAMANGGNLMKPIMADSDDVVVLRRVLSPETSQKMKMALQEVVLSGTAKGKDRGESSFYTTAGKTASARLNEYMKIDWYGGDNHANFAGFIGFAPVKNPRVQVFVGLINPNTDKTGAHGGEHAAPVFKEVTENVLAFMKVAPDKI